MSQQCAVILAGGEGTRMRSQKPKTLSMVLEKPMLQWVLDALKESGIDRICIVTGYKRECIDAYIKTLPYPLETVFQSERLGTGHAVMTAKDFLQKNTGGDVVVLNGDAPFMDGETIRGAYALHKEKQSSATVISANVDDPSGYGRIVRDKSTGALCAIVEQKDTDGQTVPIREVNSGAYWFNIDALLGVLDNITTNNNAREYYLPDALKLLLQQGKTVQAFTAPCADAVLGANDPQQLAELNRLAEKKYGSLHV